MPTAAFLTPGSTTTHFAPSKTLPGMPLSGAARISFSTLPDSVMRSFSFSPEAAQPEEIRPIQTSTILVKVFIPAPRNDPLRQNQELWFVDLIRSSTVLRAYL